MHSYFARHSILGFLRSMICCILFITFGYIEYVVGSLPGSKHTLTIIIPIVILQIDERYLLHVWQLHPVDYLPY